MAIANMKFVKVIGLLSELDAFLGSCCVDGTFQPEQAMQYMSDSMGYTQLVEENPYAPMLQKRFERPFDRGELLWSSRNTEAKCRI